MSTNDGFDSFFGVDTSTPVKVPESKDYYIYEPTEYDDLIRIFDRLPITSYDTVVDFGCGLGRVLFYCNQRFMCKVTGVELDRDIYRRLADNADVYHSKFLNQRRKFSLLWQTAEEYIIEPTDNYFYFFNPFSKPVLKEVLGNIIASHEKCNRKITVIFYYCTFDMMSVIREFPFKLQEIIKLKNYEEDPDEKAYIYYIE